MLMPIPVVNLEAAVARFVDKFRGNQFLNQFKSLPFTIMSKMTADRRYLRKNAISAGH